MVALQWQMQEHFLGTDAVRPRVRMRAGSRVQSKWPKSMDAGTVNNEKRCGEEYGQEYGCPRLQADEISAAYTIWVYKLASEVAGRKTTPSRQNRQETVRTGVVVGAFVSRGAKTNTFSLSFS